MFGYDSTEKVEGWTCRIFEANGRMIATEHLKVLQTPVFTVSHISCSVGGTKLQMIVSVRDPAKN